MPSPFEGFSQNGDEKEIVILILEEVFSNEGMEIFRDGSAAELSFIDSLEEILRQAKTGDTTQLRELHRRLVDITDRLKEKIEMLEDAL